MAMEMTAVWKERKSRSPFPLFPHCLGKLAKTASFPHSHSFGDDLGFPSSPSSFNFNCNEKCSLHARYLLLPTCQFAHTDMPVRTQQSQNYSIQGLSSFHRIGPSLWNGPFCDSHRCEALHQGTTSVGPHIPVRTGQVGNKRYRASG
jgi:hypothetical protein